MQNELVARSTGGAKALGRFSRILVIGALVACGGNNAAPPVPPVTLKTLTVTPGTPSVPAGFDQQFAATGNYSDGSSKALTSGVTWTTSDATIATVVAASGMAHGVAAGGPVTITATASGISGSATLAITPAVLQTITLSPPSASLASNVDMQFTASGHFSDGSDLILPFVTWTTSNAAIATVDPAVGTAHTIAPGAATITATDAPTGLFGSATLTVTPAVPVSVSVAPLQASIPVGFTRQFVASVNLSDGTSQVLTSGVVWTSSVPGTATVDPATGLALGVAAGGAQTIITATASGLGLPPASNFGTALLTVTALGTTNAVTVPFTSTVDPTGVSQLKVTGLSANAEYLARITSPSANPVTLDVYADGTFTTPLCSSFAGGAPCPAVASAAGELFVLVSGTPGDAFTLTAPLLPVLIAPVTSLPEGPVSPQAFFKVTGLTPGSFFEARLDGLSDDADIYVTDSFDSGATFPATVGLLCFGNAFSSGTHPERCVGTVPGSGTVYVRVDASLSLAPGATFAMTVLDATPVALDHAPVAFAAPFASFAGTVGDGSPSPSFTNSTSHYKITGLTAGLSYTVSFIAPATGDADLEVYADPNFGTLLCFSNNPLTSVESCAAVPTTTDLYVLADGFFGPVASTFTVTVTQP